MMDSDKKEKSQLEKLPWTPRMPLFGNPGGTSDLPNISPGVVSGGQRISRDAEDMLIKAWRKNLTLTLLYADLGLSAHKGVKTKKELINQGLVAEVPIDTNRRGPRKKLLQVLPKGRQYLKSLGITGGPRGRGGVRHQYYQTKLKEWYQRRGHTAEIEARVGDTSLDVLVIRKDGERLGIEIAMSEHYEIVNARKAVEAGLEYLLFICETREIMEKLRKRISAVKELWHRTKIGFKLISEYNLEE